MFLLVDSYRVWQSTKILLGLPFARAGTFPVIDVEYASMVQVFDSELSFFGDLQAL